MLTAARNASTAEAAPRARTAGAARPAPVEPRAPSWTRTGSLAALMRSLS